MSVLGRFTAAVVGRGGKLLRRGAEGATRRVPVPGTAGFRRSTSSALPRGAEGPLRKNFKSVGPGSSPPSPMEGPYVPREMASARAEAQLTENLAGKATARARFGSGGTARTGAFKPKADEPTVVTKKTTRGPEALRRASVVTRRYFTQGTAGSGLNLKRAVGAAAVPALATGYGLAKIGDTVINSNSRKANSSQRSAETASQATPTSSSIAAADLSSPSSSASTSSSDSTSTSQSPVTRTDSTTGIGGALQGEMRASAKAVRPDRDYMGESFDASLRKGVDTGRNYLKQQLASDKVDSKRQRTLLDQYDRRIGKDTLLGRDRGVGYLKNSDSDQSQKDLLAAYRGRFGNYRKNARATEVEAMAKSVARKRGE